MNSFVVSVVVCLTFGTVGSLQFDKRYREKACDEEDSPECETWADFGWCEVEGYANTCPHICLRCCEFPVLLQTNTTGEAYSGYRLRYSGYRLSLTNKTATYRCFNGWKYADFEIGGDATCSNDSVIQLPSCIKSECRFTKTLELQERVELLGDDTAVYRCNEGFIVQDTASNEGIAVCNNGTVDYPTCVAACTLPESVEHGYMTDMFYSNNTALYQCYTGYMYDTNVTTAGVGRCDADGNAVLPSCIYTGCLYPYNIANGRKTEYYSEEGRARYSCDAGCVFEDGSDGLVECVDGVLEIPECVEDKRLCAELGNC